MVRMAECGARGYIIKSQPTAELLAAIKHVFRGGLHFSAGMTAALRGHRTFRNTTWHTKHNSE